jgi:hypothetical protein
VNLSCELNWTYELCWIRSILRIVCSLIYSYACNLLVLNQLALVHVWWWYELVWGWNELELDSILTCFECNWFNCEVCEVLVLDLELEFRYKGRGMGMRWGWGPDGGMSRGRGSAFFCFWKIPLVPGGITKGIFQKQKNGCTVGHDWGTL